VREVALSVGTLPGRFGRGVGTAARRGRAGAAERRGRGVDRARPIRANGRRRPGSAVLWPVPAGGTPAPTRDAARHGTTLR
jgi:hypothetical protein